MNGLAECASGAGAGSTATEPRSRAAPGLGALAPFHSESRPRLKRCVRSTPASIGTTSRPPISVHRSRSCSRTCIAWRIRGPPVQTIRPRTVRRVAASSIRMPAAKSVPLVPDSAAPIPLTLRVPRRAPTFPLESSAASFERRSCAWWPPGTHESPAHGETSPGPCPPATARREPPPATPPAAVAPTRRGGSRSAATPSSNAAPGRSLPQAPQSAAIARSGGCRASSHYAAKSMRRQALPSVSTVHCVCEPGDAANEPNRYRRSTVEIEIRIPGGFALQRCFCGGDSVEANHCR